MMKKLILTVAALTICVGLFAQTPQPPAQKIGYVAVEYVKSQMPDFKAAENEMKTQGNQYEKLIQAKRQDLEKRIEEFQKNPPKDEFISKNTETELINLQQSLQQFVQDAQATMEKKSRELTAPIFKKISLAIDAVAKEQNFTLILTQDLGSDADIVLYADPSVNISDAVLKKLGITPGAATATPAKPK